MSNLQPVSFSRHGNLLWRRSADYQFAAATVVAPIAASEVSQAALALPLAFVQQGGHWRLAAVLGLVPGQNLFVAANGSWLARYIPAAFRGYPFVIGSRPDGEATLCVDEASGLLTESPDAERFFDDAGALSPFVNQVLNFLTEVARGEALLISACEHLVDAGVVEVWPITLQGEQGLQQVVGLHRINEAALNGLDDATFSKFRRSGVLGVAYAQLVSMGNLPQLGQLAQARAQAEADERDKAEVKPMLTLPDDNTIDWDWSKIGR